MASGWYKSSSKKNAHGHGDGDCGPHHRGVPHPGLGHALLSQQQLVSLAFQEWNGDQ